MSMPVRMLSHCLPLQHFIYKGWTLNRENSVSNSVVPFQSLGNFVQSTLLHFIQLNKNLAVDRGGYKQVPG